jgi:hypothetical protein
MVSEFESRSCAAAAVAASAGAATCLPPRRHPGRAARAALAGQHAKIDGLAGQRPPMDSDSAGRRARLRSVLADSDSDYRDY